MKREPRGIRVAVVAAAVAVAGPGVPAARATVYLNELTIQGTESVELYNSGPDTVDVNGWTIQGGQSWVVQGAPLLPPDDYLLLSPPANLFVEQGGYIELLDVNVKDGLYYGQIGSAPLPPPSSFPRGRAAPATLARAPDASTYGGASVSPSPSSDGAIWTIDVTPTPGAPNDAPAPALGTSLLINELDPKPVGGGDLVELVNPFAVGVPVTGWFLCNGDAFLPLAGTVPGGGYLTIHTPPGFDLETDELVYLFRDDEVRVDQVGFHLPPVRRSAPTLDFCQCYARYPDGTGPNLGYDWFSSGGGSTLLLLICTPGATNALQSSCATTAAPVPGPQPRSWSRTKAAWRR